MIVKDIPRRVSTAQTENHPDLIMRVITLPGHLRRTGLPVAQYRFGVFYPLYSPQSD